MNNQRTNNQRTNNQRTNLGNNNANRNVTANTNVVANTNRNVAANVEPIANVANTNRNVIANTNANTNANRNVVANTNRNANANRNVVANANTNIDNELNNLLKELGNENENTNLNNTNNNTNINNNNTNNNNRNKNTNNNRNRNVNNNRNRNVNNNRNNNKNNNNNKKNNNNNTVKNNNNNKNNNKNKNNNNNRNKAIAVGMMNNTMVKAEAMYNNIKSSTTLMTIIKVIGGIIIFMVIVHIVKKMYLSYKNYYLNSPYLLEGTKNAKHARVISQNPENTNYIAIKKSENRDGIEFTYSWWFMIDNFTYKKGEWKHMFHKGNASSYPNRAPGVWIHPEENIIRIYMNTQSNILKHIDVDNIPVRKWVHMAIILKNKVMEVYVNGYMKTRKDFTSLPRQNDGDFWMNMFGGFEGYMSRLRYYSYAIDYNELDNTISKGPSGSACIDTGESPPYLDDNWWY